MKIIKSFHVEFIGTKKQVEAAYAKWFKENAGVEVVETVSSWGVKASRISVFYRSGNTDNKYWKRLVPDLINNKLKNVLDIKKSTRILEKTLIKKVLNLTHGNRTHACKILGISHRALLYKIVEYGLE